MTSYNYRKGAFLGLSIGLIIIGVGIIIIYFLAISGCERNNFQGCSNEVLGMMMLSGNLLIVGGIVWLLLTIYYFFIKYSDSTAYNSTEKRQKHISKHRSERKLRITMNIFLLVGFTFVFIVVLIEVGGDPTGSIIIFIVVVIAIYFKMRAKHNY